MPEVTPRHTYRPPTAGGTCETCGLGPLAPRHRTPTEQTHIRAAQAALAARYRDQHAHHPDVADKFAEIITALDC